MLFYPIAQRFFYRAIRKAIFSVMPFFFVGVILHAKGCSEVAFCLIATSFGCLLWILHALYKKMKNFSFECPQCGNHVCVDLWNWKCGELKTCSKCGNKFEKDYETITAGGFPYKKS